jgi:RHS repeat-associated protein
MGGRVTAAAEESGARADPETGEPALPAIERPVGGGAIRGIDEHVSVAPSTGAATLTVPLPLTAGRSDTDPELTLTYAAGSGDGVFGIGWSAEVGCIRRRLDTGVPRYVDPIDGSTPDSDVFTADGDDLVPVLDGGAPRRHPCTLHGTDYVVCAYRPRTEGAFTRFERWTEVATGQSHWRGISRDDAVSLYGLDDHSRVHDPAAPGHTSVWHVDRTFDDRGNVALYRWVAEDARGVDVAVAHEQARPAANREVQRYLKSLHWGNRTPYEPDWSAAGAPAPLPERWLFSAVLDYGDHSGATPGTVADRDWTVRTDPFSSYRSGFEVRTYRRCRRVLVYHDLPDEPAVGARCLVRSVSLDYDEGGDTATFSRLRSVTFRGHRRLATGGYVTRSLPPIEFDYTEVRLGGEVVDVDPSALGDLPAGLAGAGRRFVDLDGDGLSGVLTVERGEVSFARNVSAATDRPAGAPSGPWFEPRRSLTTLPNLAAPGKAFDVWDVDHDGRPEFVRLDRPPIGYHERDGDGWGEFVEFAAVPPRTAGVRGARLADLTGDGGADLVVADGDRLHVYAGLGPAGFAEAVTQTVARDRDGTVADDLASQRVLLADMSGDGLPDVVTVDRRRVAYWPNLGWGRFGPRVVLDGSPLAGIDAFDAARVRLADLDGTGTADLVYLGADGLTIAHNRAGNAWSEPVRLPAFLPPGEYRDAQVVDLLGTGTSCLVWSSTAPGEAGSRMRYMHLVPEKPHLLTRVTNNRGAETRIRWQPSTRFASEDRLAGRPWLTRLPFPVHVVERLVRIDLVSRSRFVTRYAYHHGHYDGTDREFRGFAMVETWDTEQRPDDLAALLADADATNWREESHTPPVWTRTWFHTGAYADRDHISRRHVDDYWLEPGARDDPARLAAALLPDTVLDPGLDEHTRREACRALRGKELRREVFALDASQAAGHPYAVSERDYTVRVLQPAGQHSHAVAMAVARETLDCYYDRDPADPRVQSEVTLQADVWGNPLRQVTVTYPRRAGHAVPEPGLPPTHRAMLARDQGRLTVLATLSAYTDPIDGPDAQRTPLEAETLTAELLGLAAPDGPGQSTPRFAFAELDAAWAAAFAAEEPPERVERADVTGLDGQPGPLRYRVIGRVRTRYRSDDLTALLPVGRAGALAVPGRTDTLAFSQTQLDAIFGAAVTTAELEAAGYVRHDGGPGWWIPGPRERYTPGDAPPAAELAEARAHFWRPRRSVDAFGNVEQATYDRYDLSVVETIDAVGNRTAAAIDYRVLQPLVVTDPNGDRSFAAYDALGATAATASAGRAGEDLGDSLDGLDPDPSPAQVAAFLADPAGSAAALLGDATLRVVSDPLAFHATSEDVEPAAVWVATIRREVHSSEQAAGGHPAVQMSVAHLDGYGEEVQTKERAEPGPLPGLAGAAERWITSGWTVRDNKGQPVEEYEPLFTSSPRYEFDRRSGVSTVTFYDPIGRTIGRLRPDATLERFDHTPWRRTEWDAADMCLVGDPTADEVLGGSIARRLAARGAAFTSWHDQRAGGGHGDGAEQRAANRAAAEQSATHAGTPTTVHLDAAGRDVLTVTDDGNGGRHGTRVAVDGSGRGLGVVDALGRSSEQFLLAASGDGGSRWVSGIDVAGRMLTSADIDGGRRRLLPDADGAVGRVWDGRGRLVRTVRDANRRVTHRWLSAGDGAERLLERVVWGDDIAGQAHPEADRRLRGRPWRSYDQSGLTRLDRFDFKGNPVSSTRVLALAYREDPDWSPVAAALDVAALAAAEAPLLDAGSAFASSARYDALDRLVAVTTPHGSGLDPHTIRSRYNRGGLLEALDVWIGDADPPADPAGADHHPLVAVDYNARRQTTNVVFGNGAETAFEYDPLTFRQTGIRTTRRRGGREDTLQDLRLTHDAVGNPTRIADASEPALFYAGAVVEASADYTYDALNRLVGATGREHLGQNGGAPGAPVLPGPRDPQRAPHPTDGQAMGRYRQEFGYDPVGNLEAMLHRTANGGWTRRYRYSEPSRIDPAETANRLSATSLPGDPEGGPFSARYTHDEHGNLTSMPHLPGLAWDADDRLRSATHQVRDGGAGETTFYVYDSEGDRARKVTDSGAADGDEPRRRSERVYLGGIVELYREFGAGGQVRLRRETVHVLAGDERIALLERRTAGADDGPAELLRYQHHDHLGSSVLELDEQARVVSRASYHPYGTTAHCSARSVLEAPNRYRYTGRERDEETGFGYHGARYYAPWLGRWTSPDPAGLVDGPNRYAYVRGNPLRGVDPSGRQTKTREPEQKRPAPTQPKAEGKQSKGGQEAKANAPPSKAASKTLRIHLLDESAMGFRKFDKTAREALRAGVEQEFDFLKQAGIGVEADWKRVTGEERGPGDLDVAIIDPNASEDKISKLLKRYGQEPTDKLVSEVAANLKAEHGQRIGVPGKPGALLVPIGSIYQDLASIEDIGGTDEAKTTARKTAGVAAAKLVAHEIGHDLGLGHTKVKGKQVISDPPRIMDWRQSLSTSTDLADLAKVKFTKTEERKLTAAVKKRLK